MLKTMQTEQKDDCLLIAGEKDQIAVLDVTVEEEHMIGSHYCSYFSLFHSEDFQYLEDGLITGIHLEDELFNWMENL